MFINPTNPPPTHQQAQKGENPPVLNGQPILNDKAIAIVLVFLSIANKEKKM